MQNMVVGSFIENIKTKIFIKFHFINFMTYLARVANSMVIFSASYPNTSPQYLRRQKNITWHVFSDLFTDANCQMRKNRTKSASPMTAQILARPFFIWTTMANVTNAWNQMITKKEKNNNNLENSIANLWPQQLAILEAFASTTKLWILPMTATYAILMVYWTWKIQLNSAVTDVKGPTNCIYYRWISIILNKEIKLDLHQVTKFLDPL